MCISLPMPCPTYSSTMPYGPAARTEASTACETSVSRFPALPQRGLAGLEQLGQLRADLPHPDGDRGVAVPAVHDRAAVDGDDVAVAQDRVRARDAVHDDLVR